MKSTSMNSNSHAAQGRASAVSAGCAGAAHHKGQHGLTLIEVMISITISLILLAGVMQIFTSSRQTYRVQDSMARLQENGRFALSFLSRDVRLGDYWGCLADPTVLVNNLAPAGAGFIPFSGANGVTGANDTGLKGSDTITLNAATPVTGGITIIPPFMANTASPIQVTVPNLLRVGNIVVIANCTNADVFQIQSGDPGGNLGVGVAGSIIHAAGIPVGPPLPVLPAGPGNNVGGTLSARYAADAQLMTAQSITYSIQADPANGNEPTLFSTTNGVNVALVEGVENMQILYGEDTDPRLVTIPPTPLTPANYSANRYVPANTVGLVMANVVSIRIGLVLRTKENNLSTSVQSYNFNGAVVTPADRRLRRVFSTTIGLRNRGA